MKYYLMHKDYKAAVLEINVEYGAIEKISTLQKALHFPFRCESQQSVSCQHNRLSILGRLGNCK